MLDENLPTFFLKASADKLKHHESYYFTQNGSDPDAQYALHHVDPSSNDAKNTYAVALFDSYRPDILFGEVLAKPGWTHPTLSQEEIRKNGGVPPPPQPIYPTEFAIQLYNPDTQVIVKQQTTKWSSTISWEFSIPQITFRMPSNSDLDRTQIDPSTDVNTPRVKFAWRKEGRMGKDLTCYMTGKSTDLTGKKAKKTKDPDIAVALFSGLREMSIMEPNLYRVEIEDYKGLEVVLLLSAAVIRDLFFGDPREQFHVSDVAARKNSGGVRTRKGSSPVQGAHITPPVMTPQPPPPPAYTGPSQYPPEKVPLQPASGAALNAQMQPPSYTPNNNAAKRSSLPPLQTGTHQAQPQQQRPPQGRTFAQHQQQLQQHPQQPQRPQQPQQPPRPQQQQAPRPPQRTQQAQPGPRLDPRAQWEIDAETARLKAQVEAEEREQKRKAEAEKKARKRREQEEERQTLQFLEQEKKQKEREEKERRRKQAEVDKETERLKKQFGDQSTLLRPTLQNQNRHSIPLIQGPWTQGRQQQQRPAPVPTQPSNPYLAPGSHRPTASHSSFFANGLPKPQVQPKAKKSFWGLRMSSETTAEKLKKKKSSMF